MKNILMVTGLIHIALALSAWSGDILSNGDFASDELTPWKAYSTKGQEPMTATVNEGELHLAIPSPAPEFHNRQLIQPVHVQSETGYVLTFDIKVEATEGEEVVVVLGRTKRFDAGHYGLFRRFKPETDWKTFRFSFDSIAIDDDDPPALKFSVGNLAGGVSFRNVSLVPKP